MPVDRGVFNITTHWALETFVTFGSQEFGTAQIQFFPDLSEDFTKSNKAGQPKAHEEFYQRQG